MSPIASLGAIISGVVLLQGGMGLMTTLLPLKMQEAGFSSFEIGTMAAGFSGGFLLGCIFAPHLVGRIGHIRAFSVFAAGMAALTLGFAIGIDLYFWTALRILVGFCFAGLLNVSDSWISGETDKSIRGRVLSIYMVLYKLAQASGPILLTFGELTGHWQLMLVSALFSFSLLPVALRRGGNPTPPSTDRMHMIDVFRVTPISVVGCVTLGMMNSPINNLMPLYASQVGLGVAGAATLAAALQVGALVVQWPMGMMSDRRDRRHVMIFGVIVLSLLCAVLAFAPPLPIWGYAIMVALIGGFGLSVYPVILAHASDFCDPKQMVPLCSTLMLGFSFGMVIGPLTASTMMELIGPGGLFMHAILVAIPFVAYAFYRMTRRAVLPVEERTRFVYVPATSTAVKELHPEAPHPEIDEAISEAFGEDDAPDGTHPDEKPHSEESSR